MASTGVVRSFSMKNGFGFIESEMGDIFVHGNECKDLELDLIGLPAE